MNGEIKYTVNKYGHVLVTSLDSKHDMYIQSDYDIHSFACYLGFISHSDEQHVADEMTAVYTWLDDHEGDTFENPGYTLTPVVEDK